MITIAIDIEYRACIRILRLAIVAKRATLHFKDRWCQGDWFYDHGYWYGNDCVTETLPIIVSMDHGVFRNNRHSYDPFAHDAQRPYFHKLVLYNIPIIIYGTIPDSKSMV